MRKFLKITPLFVIALLIFGIVFTTLIQNQSILFYSLAGAAFSTLFTIVEKVIE